MENSKVRKDIPLVLDPMNYKGYIQTVWVLFLLAIKVFANACLISREKSGEFFILELEKYQLLLVKERTEVIKLKNIKEK